MRATARRCIYAWCVRRLSCAIATGWLLERAPALVAFDGEPACCTLATELVPRSASPSVCRASDVVGDLAMPGKRRWGRPSVGAASSIRRSLRSPVRFEEEGKVRLPDSVLSGVYCSSCTLCLILVIVQLDSRCLNFWPNLCALFRISSCLSSCCGVSQDPPPLGWQRPSAPSHPHRFIFVAFLDDADMDRRATCFLKLACR